MSVEFICSDDFVESSIKRILLVFKITLQLTSGDLDLSSFQ